jgi:hypothetical protein
MTAITNDLAGNITKEQQQEWSVKYASQWKPLSKDEEDRYNDSLTPIKKDDTK